MTIYVTDANIFIDLIYADLLDAFIALNWEITTTVLVVNELEPMQQQLLQRLVASGHLKIGEVTYAELVQLNVSKGLSQPDKSVLCLALRESGYVLSGDGLVRKTASHLGIQVFGLLKVFDELIDTGLISPGLAVEKLTWLIEEMESRQPVAECTERLERWRTM